MIEDMTVRNLSPATQQSYLNAISKFSRYFGRSPDRLGLEDVHAFQVHLVATGISWPALNQIVCALRFFYGVTLGQAIVPERIAYAREPSKLPVVLSADEVVRFLEAIPSLKSRTALTTVYAAGLRVSEVVLLKIADIDSQRMVIRVEQGKGQGPLRYALSAAPEDSTHLLAARSRRSSKEARCSSISASSQKSRTRRYRKHIATVPANGSIPPFSLASNSKSDGAVVIVMQRLHEDDLAGRLLEKGGWHHLKIPAIAEQDEPIPIGPGRIYRRKAGTVIDPRRESLEDLETLETADDRTVLFGAVSAGANSPCRQHHQGRVVQGIRDRSGL